MTKLLKSVAWPLGIIALALLVIGLIAVTAPNMTIGTIMLYFGIMLIIIGGVQGLVAVLLRKTISLWIALLMISLAFLGLGAYMIYNPDKSGAAFENIISFWAVGTGIIQLILAIRNQATRIFLMSAGILSIAIGLILYFSENTQNMQFLFGFYTLLLSLVLLMLVYRIIRMKPDDNPM